MCTCAHSRLWLQDRHLLIEDFQPSKAANLKERCPEVRSLVGVFDGHKRSEPAETAARRLPELLSRSDTYCAGIGRVVQGITSHPGCASHPDMRSETCQGNCWAG